MNDFQKDLYNSYIQLCEKPIEHTYYKVLWVDRDIFDPGENLVYHHVFKDLKYSGFQGVSSVEQFKEILDDNLTNDNLLVISSGAFVKQVIEVIKKQKVRKVQKIIVFCRNKKYHEHLLEGEKDLVLSIINEFSDLTRKFNDLIKTIELQRDEEFRKSELNFFAN
jgi:hypothetical protein